MKKLLHADLTAILGLIPLYQPTEAGSLELDLLKLQQGGAADYLFLARRERSWLFDPPRVYEPAVMKICAGWPFRTGLGGRCSPCSSMWRSLWADGPGGA